LTAYWIAHVTVTDPEAYRGYQALAPVAFARFGGQFLARGGESEVMEGPELSRHVVIVFPSLQAAKDCYASPEYSAARTAREGAATVHLTIVEGVAP
jgi:uncharacterized protein (DUF1330 family)